MEIKYNYQPYELPKQGVFKIDDNIYGPNGWGYIESERLILGETKDHFVYELLATTQGEWVGDKVIYESFILPIGVHKSRFIKWSTNFQLSLF
jgi:hypothetical protein